MKLPKTSRELKDLFHSAECPGLSEFEGEYLVDMLTVWPSFKGQSHIKVIYREDNIVYGYNKLFNKQFGHFFMEEDTCRNFDLLKTVVINYDHPKNLPPVSGVRDHIRTVEKGSLYLGRFNLAISGYLFFLGYFSLEKIK